MEEGHTVFELNGTHYFDPMNHRPMKGWVQVPYDYHDQWPSIADAAMQFVSSLPANQKKKK